MPVLLGIVLYAAVEIAAVVAVASWLGIGWTLLLLLGLSLLGLVLLRREGSRAWRSFQRRGRRAAGRRAARCSTACSVLLGAVLIVLPGFVTDVLALLCLLPFSRRLHRPGAGRLGADPRADDRAAGQLDPRPGRGPAGRAAGRRPVTGPARGRAGHRGRGRATARRVTVTPCGRRTPV